MNFILIGVAYLIGAIPVSLIVGKVFLGIDIREHGSKNPGATNAIRVMGKKYGVPVFIFDVLKGAIIVLLVNLGWLDFLSDQLFHPLVYGMASIVGHVYPVFIKFKGGKAVATSLGVFLAYAPVIGLAGALGFVISLKQNGWVSVSSTVGALSLSTVAIIIYFFGPTTAPLTIWLGARGILEIPIIALIGTALIIIRHKKNYQRLKAGTEPKIKSFQKK